VQLGHSQRLFSAVFSPDGRFVATASEDKTARVWEAATGNEIRRFSEHPYPVSSVAFSPDSRFLLTGSWDGIARLWDVATGKEIRRFPHRSANAPSAIFAPDGLCVTFSPDGQFVLIGSWDATASLWDAKTGNELHRFQGHTDRVVSVAFSPSGRSILTTSWDNTARLWDVATRMEIRNFQGHTDVVWSAAFSPDGRLVVTGSWDRTVRVWDAKTGSELRQFQGLEGGKLPLQRAGIRSVAFSPDGGFILTGSDDFTARLWNAATGVAVRTFQGHASVVQSVRFSPDGQLILTGSEDRTARLWETVTGTVARSFGGYSSVVAAVAFSPDSRFILTGSGDMPGEMDMFGFSGERGNYSAFLWDVTAGKAIQRFPGHPSAVSSVAFSPDSRVIATASGDTVMLWEPTSGKELRRFQSSAGVVSSVAFSPDGCCLLANPGSTPVLWEVATGHELRRFQGHAAAVLAVAFSPDGRFIVTGSWDHTARLWEVATGREVRRFQKHTSEVTSVAFSPDGRSIVTGSLDNTACLWDVASEKERHCFPGLSPVRFSPDGRFVLTGGNNFTPTLWEAATGKAVRRFPGHTDAVWATAFSPDGRFILTGSSDNTARLWAAATGQELGRLFSFGDGTWVVVDPEGRFDTDNLDGNPGLRWVMPDDPLTPLPLEIFMRDYYEPRLLPRILAGEKFKAVRALQDLNRVQPHVRISKIEPRPQAADTVSVTVAVAKAAREFQRGGKRVMIETGAYDLRLFRDGQLVGYAPESEGEIALDGRTGTAVRTFTITLPRSSDRKEVEFSAYAFNVDRVKSTTDRQTFVLPSEVTPAKGRAYVITVGVNAYENSAWDLRFAANDARRIAGALRERLAANRDYEAIISIPLISDSEMRNGERIVTENLATKRKVQAVLELLAGKLVALEHVQGIPHADQIRPARPEDLILISISSHGYADDTGNFYFLLSDIGAGTGRQLTPELLRRALSSDELSRWLRDVDGGEMTLIVDACHSAATVESAGFKPGPMGSRGLGQLAYDKGMRILTASQVDDVALESDLLRQGLLTYALVQDGLEARQADFAPKDRRIMLAEWLGYGVERVPTLDEEVKKGAVQSFGQKSRGVVVLFTQSDTASRKTGVQKPALFDFARRHREVVLVGGK
jgi:WD40 repeat protein